MRKFKTGRNNRTTYIYYSEDGSRTVLRPGEDGVTEADIALLHEMDDDDFNNDRRESSTERFSPLEEWLVENEKTESPESLDETLLKNMTAENLHSAIDTLLPAQKELLYKVHFCGMKLTEIAHIEGVSKASVHERLQRIYKKLKKVEF